MAVKRKSGTVKSFNASEGVGYLTPDPDQGMWIDELYIRPSSIQLDGGFIEEGARVTFVVEQGPNGLQATDVRTVG
ncbi:cold shock domain-containing protein [Streptomyces sp. NBC_01276]|uniref:cold-shock protein n=1 Tax=Streptomyces sp. NBC_01276 TaxID=2903808 RepID=UPI002F90859D